MRIGVTCGHGMGALGFVGGGIWNRRFLISVSVDWTLDSGWKKGKAKLKRAMAMASSESVFGLILFSATMAVILRACF